MQKQIRLRNIELFDELENRTLKRLIEPSLRVTEGQILRVTPSLFDLPTETERRKPTLVRSCLLAVWHRLTVVSPFFSAIDCGRSEIHTVARHLQG